MAKYGTPKWPWAHSFSRFYRGRDYIDTGIAHLAEPKAQFQNAFGAFKHVNVECEYDLNAGKVLSIGIND
jgi:hypothetical protein